MSRMVLALFILVLTSASVHSGTANAQSSLRTRYLAPKALAIESSWSGFTRYSILTDYSDSRQPRGYTNSLRAGVGYKFDPRWSLTGDASLRFETIDGKIQKGPEQSHAEVLNPSTAIELDFEDQFAQQHSYTAFVHGEPLWDEPSRLEGYKGIVGGGASVSFRFFRRIYTFENILDVSELINTYKYGLDASANPDLFYTYKMVHGIRLTSWLRASYAWGIKMTRYLDGFTGYTYSNTVSLAASYRKAALALAYDNGGFTDNGEVSLWYIDQYRRVLMLSASLSF